jgi:hypothetical protein
MICGSAFVTFFLHTPSCEGSVFTPASPIVPRVAVSDLCPKFDVRYEPTGHTHTQLSVRQARAEAESIHPEL